MKRSYCFIILLLIVIGSASISHAFGQYYFYNNKYYDNDIVFEIGGSIGAMNSITDIGGQERFAKKRYLNEINWKNTKNSYGAYFGVSYKNVVTARLELTYGNVEGVDSILTPSPSRYKRNLSFRSSIREVSLLFEFHPMMLKYYEEGPPRISPFVVAGVGWFTFNPQGRINSTWYDLQPLRTEGQGFAEYPNRKPYKLSQPNLAFGLGIRYELTDDVNLRFEWLHRYLFTDYLDDASTTYIEPALFDKYLSPTNAANAKVLYKRDPLLFSKTAKRGDPKNNDVYFSINLKVGYTFGRSRR